jgi:restriction endonuclease S subunit
MKNINPNLREVNSFEKIEIDKIKGYTPFEEGDLAFAKVTPCMENGNLAICENMPFKIGVGTSEIYIFREKQKDKISNSFLKNLFSIDQFRQFAKSNFTGTGGLQRVPRDFLNNLKIPLPPPDIQNKIVEIMDLAYALKKQNKKEAEALLTSIDDYILSELGIELPEIEEKKVFTVNFNDIKNNRADTYYYLPKFKNINDTIQKSKYEIKTLNKLIDCIESGQRPKGGVRQIPEGIPSIGGEHVLSNGKIEEKKLKYIPTDFHLSHLKSKLLPNDILIVKDGATTGKIGFFDKSYPFDDVNINEHVFLLRSIKAVNPYYLFSFLRTTIAQKLIGRDITGATVTGIIKDFIFNISIPLPPLDIQNRIASKVKNRMDTAERLKADALKAVDTAKQKVEKILFRD